MTKIALLDKEFAHLQSYCGYDKPQYFEWDRSGQIQDNGIAVFTERCFDMIKTVPAKIKIAWLLEPPAIHDYGYNQIVKGLYNDVDYILTFEKTITDMFPQKSKFWSPGGTWLWKTEWGKYEKTKNVSMLASNKNWTEGHRLRLRVIQKVKDKIDLVAGYGHNPVEPKILAYKDFRYSIAIENSRIGYYWTDKLMECFLTYTVPVYWGCPDLSRYGFDESGIIRFNNEDDIEEKLAITSPEDYERRMPSLHKNFEAARKYAIVEDYMWESFLKEIV